MKAGGKGQATLPAIIILLCGPFYVHDITIHIWCNAVAIISSLMKYRFIKILYNGSQNTFYFHFYARRAAFLRIII